MGRRRLTPLSGVVLLLMLLGVAAAGALASGSSVTVNRAQNGTLGAILVTAGGRTLYHDSSEAKNVVKCTGSCASTWPPLLLIGVAKAVAGPGVKAGLLGTVKRPDGKLQIAYDGKPLYLYSGDAKAGQVNGQGVGATWHVINPSGSIVTKAVVNTPTGMATGTSSSSGSGSSSTGSGSSSTGTSSTGSGSSSDAAICAADPMDCYNGVPLG